MKTDTEYTIETDDGEQFTTTDITVVRKHLTAGHDVRAEASAMPDRQATPTLVVEDNGLKRRTRFVDREDDRVDRYEETMTKAGEWRPVGHEVVDDVAISFE